MAKIYTLNEDESKRRGFPIIGIADRFPPRVPLTVPSSLARNPRILDLRVGGIGTAGRTFVPPSDTGVPVADVLRRLAPPRAPVYAQLPMPQIGSGFTRPGPNGRTMTFPQGTPGIAVPRIDTAPAIMLPSGRPSLAWLQSRNIKPSETSRIARTMEGERQAAEQAQSNARADALYRERFIDTPRAVAGTNAEAKRDVQASRTEATLYGIDQRRAGIDATNQTRAFIANEANITRLIAQGLSIDAAKEQAQILAANRIALLEMSIASAQSEAEKERYKDLIIEEYRAINAATPKTTTDTRWTDPASGEVLDMNKVVNFVNSYEAGGLNAPWRAKYAAQYELFKKQKALWLNSKTRPPQQ